MNEFYFFQTFLPSLDFEAKSFLSEAEFLALAKVYLSPSTFERLTLLKPGVEDRGKTVSSSVKKWFERDLAFREELARLRSERLQWKNPVLSYEKEVSFEIKTKALEIFQIESPRLAEEQILRLQWESIEDLEFGHHFDFEKVCFYYLKLQILLRRSVFNLEEGMKRARALVRIE